jgi:hypothetical protein
MMNDMHKKQTCFIPKDSCHELRCWGLCYEFLCCGKGLCFHIMYAFFGFGCHATNHVSTAAPLSFISVMYQMHKGRTYTRSFVVLWDCHTACQHFHVFQFVTYVPAKCPFGVRCQIVQVVCCVNDLCKCVICSRLLSRVGRCFSTCFPPLPNASDCVTLQILLIPAPTDIEFPREKVFTSKYPVTFRQKADNTPLI